MTNTVFNKTKTVRDYSNKKLFGVGETPLLDTIHKHYPKIHTLYDEMCALKWKETEIEFKQCLIDFEKAPKDASENMIKTLAWQWHNDSVAAQLPLTIIAPFEPCTEIAETETEIQSNEYTHGLTYSEIVRLSFKDPEKAMEDILAHQEVYERSGIIGETLREIQKFSITYAYHKMKELELPSEEEIRKYLILFYFVMLCLERVKFMASFAITFTICKSGYFIPIGSAVQKICQDELEIHSEYRKEVLKELMSDELGKRVFESIKSLMTSILETTVDQDLRWTKDYIFENDTKFLVGTNSDLVCQFVLFCAKDVANTYKLDTKYKFPKVNPMPHLEDYMNLSKVQMAPQEQQGVVAYTTNTIVVDDEDLIFNYEFN